MDLGLHVDGTQHPETPTGMDAHQASIVIVVLNVEGKTIFEAALVQIAQEENSWQMRLNKGRAFGLTFLFG